MIIEIEFPDGTVFTTYRNPCEFNSLEELAEDICKEMAEQYVLKKRLSPKAVYNYVRGCMRWLYPHLIVVIRERYEERCLSHE